MFTTLCVSESKGDQQWLGYGPDEEEEHEHIPYKGLQYPEEEMIQRSAQFYANLNQRRSVRFFSDKKVPREVIENIIKTAG